MPSGEEERAGHVWAVSCQGAGHRRMINRSVVPNYFLFQELETKMGVNCYSLLVNS